MPMTEKLRRMYYSIYLWLMYWWVLALFVLSLYEYTLYQNVVLFAPFFGVMLIWQSWQFRPVEKQVPQTEDAQPTTEKGTSLRWLYFYYALTTLGIVFASLIQWDYFRESISFFRGDPEGSWQMGLWFMLFIYVPIFLILGVAKKFDKPKQRV